MKVVRGKQVQIPRTTSQPLREILNLIAYYFLKLKFLFWDDHTFISNFKKQHRQILCSLYPLPAMAASCSSVVQEHNQDVDLHLRNRFGLRASALLHVLICVCVCSVLHNLIAWGGSHPQHHCQDIVRFQHYNDPSCCCGMWHPPPLDPPPCILATTDLFFIL